MSNDNRRHIEKGMFLRGGAHPAQYVPLNDRQFFPLPPDELKQRLQHFQEALEFIRNEKPARIESKEEWLRRQGYL